jgi:hypothetical protein
MPASPFQNTPCKVVATNNFDTVGTITLASVSCLTPDQLSQLFKPGGLYADMDAWFRTSFEMQACGIKSNGLYDWLMSSRKDVKSLVSVQKMDRGPSLLFPFVLARQDSFVNLDFFAITNGWQNNAYTAGVTGPLTSGDLALGATTDRVIRVVSRYGVDLDSKWFLSRDRVYISNLASGQRTDGQWKVLASEVSADNSYVDVLVASENAGSTAVYDAAPTAGVLVRGGNNVNDFESYCGNRPTIDTRHRVPFWYQTMRRGRQVDSEYKKVFARLMESNEYYAEFGDLPLAERNRQDEANYQKQWLNSFFWGKPISANQTLAGWQSLEQITSVTGAHVDPGLGGKLVAYRANMIGVVEQLRRCGRVWDLQNTSLNFYDFLQSIYEIVRARKSQGKAADSIDVFTDSVTAANMESAFIAYYKKEYGDIIRINIETGGNEWGFQWRSFTVKFPAGVKINLISHDYFDDLYNAHVTENSAAAGRFLMILEMGKPGPRGGTIYPGTIASNRKVRTLGDLEKLAALDPTFACVMEHPTDEITLVSETVTAIVECPLNNLVIQSIGSGVPDTSTGYNGPSSGPYQPLY